MLSASNHLFILHQVHGSGRVICNSLTDLKIDAKLSSARELMTSQRAKSIDIKLSNLTKKVKLAARIDKTNHYQFLNCVYSWLDQMNVISH